MAEYNFNKDIHIGEAGEKIVIRDLEEQGLVFISDNKNNTYDLLMKDKTDEVTYEVKTDVLIRPERDTNNLFIEFECRGKPSGIKVTKAKWFVTFFPYIREIWYIKTKDLISLLENENCKIATQAGDNGSNTKGYLLPRFPHKNKFIVRRIPKEWIKNQNLL